MSDITPAAIAEARAALARICRAVIHPDEWTFPLEDERAKIDWLISTVEEEREEEPSA